MTFEYTNLEKNRLEKMESLRAGGIEPYPTRARRTMTSQEAIRLFEAAEVAASQPIQAVLAGRLR